MISQRLREADSDIQDVFAQARAALDAYETTQAATGAQTEAVIEMLLLRQELGWERSELVDEVGEF